MTLGFGFETGTIRFLPRFERKKMGLHQKKSRPPDLCFAAGADSKFGRARGFWRAKNGGRPLGTGQMPPRMAHFAPGGPLFTVFFRPEKAKFGLIRPFCHLADSSPMATWAM